ncbi:MAG TPA: LysR family transcriptional regulator [Terriglobia bacterium]|nr:LysR family transcriptional regulator [Terriglobia bacterium]
MADRLRDLPPLKSLRVFEACLRLGSFSKAAQALNVGQPAISHQIHALEVDLGTRLFERRGARTIPTPEARSYYRSISEALGEMARASAALRRANRLPGLTLATYPGIATFWLMPRLSQVKQSDPDLAIRVMTAEREQDMPLDEVDCAILFGDGEWSGYESHLLVQERVLPVAAPAVAASLSGKSRDALLRAGPLIHLEDQDRRWFTWSDWRDARSPVTERMDSGIAVTDHGIAIHQALMGHGIALGWQGVIDELLRNKLLVALDRDLLSSDRGYFLVGAPGFFDTRIGGLVLHALVQPD